MSEIDDNETVVEQHRAYLLGERTLWRHLNGHEYEVICIARCDDLEVDMVIHRGVHDGRIWARSKDNFLGKKGSSHRFVYLGDAE